MRLAIRAATSGGPLPLIGEEPSATKKRSGQRGLSCPLCYQAAIWSTAEAMKWSRMISTMTLQFGDGLLWAPHLLRYIMKQLETSILGALCYQLHPFFPGAVNLATYQQGFPLAQFISSSCDCTSSSSVAWTCPGKTSTIGVTTTCGSKKGCVFLGATWLSFEAQVTCMAKRMSRLPFFQTVSGKLVCGFNSFLNKCNILIY